MGWHYSLNKPGLVNFLKESCWIPGWTQIVAFSLLCEHWNVFQKESRW
jgi:hypothetical protein